MAFRVFITNMHVDVSDEDDAQKFVDALGHLCRKYGKDNKDENYIFDYSGENI